MTSPAPDVPSSSTPEYAAFTLDRQGLVTHWSADAQRQSGHAREEVIGRPYNFLFSPEAVAAGKPAAILAAAAQDGFAVDEDWRLRRNGSRLRTKLIVTAIMEPSGNATGFSVVHRDLTELLRVQAQLNSQAAMLDQAQDAIILYDLSGKVVFWNQSASRIFGWTAAEAIGRSGEELCQPVDQPVVRAAMKDTLLNDSWQGEMHLHTKSGQPITLGTRRSLVRGPDGRPTGYLCITTDLTERKRLEAQFLRAQRMESIGILAGGIAHDLNNILAPILMSIALLKLKMPDHEGVQKQLDQLAGNAQRGANLVKQVLAFGRGIEVQRVLMQPRHIGREIEQIVSDTFPKNIEFEFSFSRDLWTVTGDPTQVHQVLLNLCVNGRDAMPGGGRLSLRMENVTLDSVYTGMAGETRAGPYVRVEVADTGTGIAPENRDRIFDPFFTTKNAGRGTGLGLATTLAIVKAHSGFITLDSQVGRGTTFRVFFPAEPAGAPAPLETSIHPDIPRGRNELILLVDDEELIREIARTTLERFGYRVLLAQHGTEAVALYALHRGDIAAVITDMAMPVMDGPATILALRTINPDVKIIGSSGQGSASAMQQGKWESSGLSHFIAKPYTAETLLHTLHQVLH